MKNILNKFIVLPLLFVSTSCFATSSVPEECPEVEVIYGLIKNGLRFQSAIKNPSAPGWLVTYPNNYFGTQNKWSFIIATNKGNNEEEAAFFARFELDDLTYGMGPELDESHTHWICKYATYNGKVGAAIAITPSN